MFVSIIISAPTFAITNIAITTNTLWLSYREFDLKTINKGLLRLLYLTENFKIPPLCPVPYAELTY